jgi:hypothetical protein
MRLVAVSVVTVAQRHLPNPMDIGAAYLSAVIILGCALLIGALCFDCPREASAPRFCARD